MDLQLTIWKNTGKMSKLSSLQFLPLASLLFIILSTCILFYSKTHVDKKT